LQQAASAHSTSAAINAAHSFDLEAELRQALKEPGASSYEQVKGRLGVSSYLGLLDAGQFAPADPGAVDAGAVVFLGPFALGDDPTRHLAGLFSSLIQPPP
jgi:hypothetical protein